MDTLASTRPTTAGPAPALRYPPLPEAMRGRGPVAAFRMLGPGAIIAAVTIGSGETLFASRSGAVFGYGLLWFVALAVVCKWIQVYTGARYMVLSGEHPMEAWARLPGPRGWFPAMLGGISIFCFPFWMGGLAKMVGTAVNWILGMGADDPRQELYAAIFGSITLALAVGLTLWQTYGVLERAQTVIVGILLASILAAVAVAPVDWSAALRGLLGFGSVSYPEWVAVKYPGIWKEGVVLTMVTFMGAIGGGPQDYIGYLGFFREKAWGALGVRFSRSAAPGADAGQGADAEVGASSPSGRGTGGSGLPAPPVIDPSPDNLLVGRSWLRAPMVDVVVGFGCVLIFTMSFNVLGASILHPDQLVPEKFELLSLQALFLDQFGAVFVVLYKLGIVTAFWANIYGALECYTRTAYDTLRPLSARMSDAPVSRFRIAVCLWAGLGGIVLMWLMAEPVSIVMPAALLASLGCGLWCFAMIWADRRYLPPGLRMRGVGITLNFLAGIILTVFAAMAIANYVKSLF